MAFQLLLPPAVFYSPIHNTVIIASVSKPIGACLVCFTGVLCCVPAVPFELENASGFSASLDSIYDLLYACREFVHPSRQALRILRCISSRILPASAYRVMLLGGCMVGISPSWPACCPLRCTRQLAFVLLSISSALSCGTCFDTLLEVSWYSVKIFFLQSLHLPNGYFRALK